MTDRGEHRVPLCRDWTAWSWFWVRGAGFPAAEVSRLAAPDSAAAADRVLARRREADEVRSSAIEILGEIIEPLSGPPRRRVAKLLKRLRRGDEPPQQVAEEADEAREALEALARNTADLLAAERELQDCFAADDARLAASLREVVADDRFREALVWQNRAALHVGADRLLGDRPARKQRQHQQMVASYLQRYCTKNDTIGFFGPVGWGRLVAEPDRSKIRAGPGLVCERTVYFEYWAIDALARRLAEDPDLKVQLPPRLSPLYRLADGELVHWMRGPIALPAEIAAVLRGCNGETAARDLAAELVAGATADYDSADEIYALLEQLEDRELLYWTLEVPVFEPRPERALRDLLEPLDGAARDRGLAALDELDAARAEVAGAAGDPSRLDPALGRLEDAFARLADTAATRRPGSMYAARTAVYEDCRRDLELQLGPELLAGIDDALALALASARWFTYDIARRFGAELERIVAELAGETETTVPFGRFYDAMAPLLHQEFGQGGPVVAASVAELQARWERILDLDHAAPRAERSSRELSDAAARAFAAPHPGWPAARHLSPDLLVAAESFEQVARGGGLVVLGELHLGNSAIQPIGLKQHPSPGELIAAYEADLPALRIQPLVPRAQVNRADLTSPSPRDFDLLTDDARSRRPRDRQVSVAELLVEQTPDGPVLRTRDRRVSFDLFSFFSVPLTSAAVTQLRFLGPHRHLPRVTVDRLVLSREQWRLEPDELGFAQVARGAQQFAAARDFSARHRMPRYVFIKVPEETKPVFVDFASPISVEIAAKQVRKASSVSISEMLPAVDQTWLPDARGDTYTCELRVVAVDPEPWRPPGGAT